MPLGLDQVISIIALIHSRTKGVRVGFLKTKCPPNSSSLYQSQSSLCLFCPDLLPVTAVSGPWKSPQLAWGGPAAPS